MAAFYGMWRYIQTLAKFGIIRQKVLFHVYIFMLNKNTLGVKKVRGQSEAALQIVMCDQNT